MFPTQLWELLYTYHVIKQCTEKENNFTFNFFIKLNYLHDCKFCFSVYCILICTCRYGWILISCLNWKLQLFMCVWIIKYIFNHLIHHIFLSLITEYWIQNIHTIVFLGFIHEQSQVDYEDSNTLFYIICTFLYR